MRLQRFDRGERGERRVAIVTGAASEEPVAAANGRPGATVGGPAHHLRLLVAVAVQEHGLAARARRLHQDHGRAALEADHVDLEPLDLSPSRPVGEEADGAVEVPVLRPGSVVHGRLRGDADVLGERGDDLLVPRPLNERARAIVIDGHGGRYSIGNRQVEIGQGDRP